MTWKGCQMVERHLDIPAIVDCAWLCTGEYIKGMTFWLSFRMATQITSSLHTTLKNSLNLIFFLKFIRTKRTKPKKILLVMYKYEKSLGSTGVSGSWFDLNIMKSYPPWILNLLWCLSVSQTQENTLCKNVRKRDRERSGRKYWYA